MSYPEEKRCVYYLEVVPKSPGFGVRWHRIGMSTLPLRSYFAHRSSCFTLLCASVSSFVLRAKWDYEMVSWVQKPHHSETSFEIHMLAWRLPIACLHPRYKSEVVRECFVDSHSSQLESNGEAFSVRAVFLRLNLRLSMRVSCWQCFLKVNAARVPFSQASNICHSYGGTLPSVLSKSEQGTRTAGKAWVLFVWVSAVCWEPCLILGWEPS